ncbi:MAG: PorP/SprF family type IX secretion system membrane protein, partial [Bacteroidota bacterium]
YNTILINPAHAGFYSGTEFTLSNRSTLNQIDGGITNIGLTFNTPLNSQNVGLGGGILRDEIGVTSTTTVFGSYAYKIHFKEGLNPYSRFKNKRFYDDNGKHGNIWDYRPSMLSFGLTTGVSFINEDLLSLDIQNDPNFQANTNVTVPMFGFGMLYSRRHIYLGISAPNLLGDRLATEDNINLNAPYYGYFGYRFYADREQTLLLKPNGLLKYERGAAPQIDLNIALNYKNTIEIGVGYRTVSSFNFLVGFYGNKNWRIFYSYQQILDNAAINNTHGLLLSYQLSRRGS